MATEFSKNQRIDLSKPMSVTFNHEYIRKEIDAIFEAGSFPRWIETTTLLEIVRTEATYVRNFAFGVNCMENYPKLNTDRIDEKNIIDALLNEMLREMPRTSFIKVNPSPTTKDLSKNRVNVFKPYQQPTSSSSVAATRVPSPAPAPPPVPSASKDHRSSVRQVNQ